MGTLSDYNNPFDAITDFENALSEYTGAPYVVTTDCCTHAIELCLRQQEFPGPVTLTRHTYLSIPMLMEKLGFEWFVDSEYEWEKEYRISPTNIFDSARRFERGMYRPDMNQCLSFGRNKPLEVGRGGAILIGNKSDYVQLKRMAYDGRDLAISPWEDQVSFELGYHYYMRPEECIIGLNKLMNGEIQNKEYSYPDISKITIGGGHE